MKVIGYTKSPLEYLKENNNFITYKGGKEQVSTACILLFGKKPQLFFPRARVRFIRYMGTEEKVGREMNVIKDVTFEGRILDQIKNTNDYLLKFPTPFYRALLQGKMHSKPHKYGVLTFT